MRVRVNDVSRRDLLLAGAGLAGAMVLPGGMVIAADEPAIGTWPAGSQGDTVTIGADRAAHRRLRRAGRRRAQRHAARRRAHQ